MCKYKRPMETRGRLLACIPVNVAYVPFSAVTSATGPKHPLNPGYGGGGTENAAG